MLQTIFFVFFLSFSTFLYTQDFRSDNKIPVSSVISLDQLQELKNYQGRDKVQKIESFLNLYLSKVQEPNIFIKENSTVNEARLFSLKESLRNTPAYLIRNSPILFELYFILGKEYVDQNQKKNAIKTFWTALRYRKFQMNEENYLAEEPLDELSPNQVANLKKYKELKEKLNQQKRELLKLEIKRYQVESRYIRQKSKNQVDLKQFQEQNLQEKNQLKLDIENLQKQYNNAYENIFLVYQRNLKQQGVEVLLQLALLVKQAELENKKNLDVEHEKLRKNQNTVFDFKKNRDFVSYQNLLEIAYRLNNKNKEVIFQLATDLKKSGKNQKALVYFLKYKDLEEDKETENYKIAIQDIAYLYESLEQFIQSVNFYKKYYLIEKDSEKVNNISFHLGYLYDVKLGNLNQSFFYYENWLRSLSKDDDNYNLQQDSKEISKQIRALFFLSRYYKKNRKEQDEIQYLNRIFSLYEDFKNNIQREKEKLESMEQKLSNLKEQIGKSNNQDASLANSNYEKKRKEKGKLTQKLKSEESLLLATLNQNPFLERLAFLSRKNNQYEDAKLYYEEIINVYKNPEKRQNIINTLQKIEKF